MDIISDIKSVYSIQTNNGAHGRIARIQKLLPLIVKSIEGNLVEIGCGVGQTAFFFLDTAIKYNRKFIAVDPWEATFRSTGDANGYTFAEFTAAIDVMSPNIIICRMDSHDAMAIKTIQDNAPLSFGFVDGDMFSAESVFTDIRTIADCGTRVICVDDQAHDAPRTAIDKFKAENTYDEYCDPAMHETYLVRRV